ncbi:hypothetical protein [Actinotalea solisilvae]|uniref:hypothetical protein n=1 Tax=Actinotalea solisilvae TaxID=2072922 RepID=UPI0018F154EC|nr:hypothetical protein [Actinotalea solisilvae]
MQHVSDDRTERPDEGRPGDGKDWYPDIVERPDGEGWGRPAPDDDEGSVEPEGGDGGERTS